MLQKCLEHSKYARIFNKSIQPNSAAFLTRYFKYMPRVKIFEKKMQAEKLEMGEFLREQDLCKYKQN